MPQQKDPTILQQTEWSIFAVPAAAIDQQFEFIGLGIVDSLTDPHGDLAPINSPSMVNAHEFIRLGKIRSAPDLGEASVVEYPQINRPSLMERMGKQLCDWHIINKATNCGRKDDLNDWQSLLHVLYAQSSEDDFGELMSRDEDNPNEFTSSISHEGIAPRVFPIRASAKAEAIVLAQILDVIYADQKSCGTCTPYSTGCNQKFALAAANAGSVGLSGQIVFTKNGTTYNTDDINSLLGGNGTSLQAMGSYLLVTQETPTPSHHYALISDVTDTPNTYNWTRVTSGYASAGPTCAVAVTSSRAFLGAENGYIYMVTDITAGVTTLTDGSLTTEDMNAIAYNDSNLLVVGDNNKILFSSNADNDPAAITFSLITGPAVGVNLTACAIISQNAWYVGAANGKFYYTIDGGDNWVERSVPYSPTYINDIQFSPDNPLIGVMAVQTATAGYLIRTIDGGRSWRGTPPAIEQYATAPEKYNAVALCGSNAVFAGGKKASSTDGLLVEAV